MGKGFLKHFHLGGKTKQNYLQKLKNGEKQNKYSSMPGKSIFGLGFSPYILNHLKWNLVKTSFILDGQKYTFIRYLIHNLIITKY